MAFLKHELTEDLECTPYLESLRSMMGSAGLDVTEVDQEKARGFSISGPGAYLKYVSLWMCPHKGQRLEDSKDLGA